VGGQAILSQTIPLNSFAINLASVLKRYFSSEAVIDNDEILTRGYVSSKDTTKYDGLLETFLRDSLQEHRDQWALNLEPTSRTEPRFSNQIDTVSKQRDPDGHLQLVIGGVGSGKSIFIRRYQRHLMPPSLKTRTRWAFLNFNSAPMVGDGTEKWVCEQLLKSLQEANEDFDPYSIDNMERIFAPLLAKRERSVYPGFLKRKPLWIDKCCGRRPTCAVGSGYADRFEADHRRFAQCESSGCEGPGIRVCRVARQRPAQRRDRRPTARRSVQAELKARCR